MTPPVPKNKVADHLRQILRAPVYEAAIVTPLQDMPRLSARIGIRFS